MSSVGGGEIVMRQCRICLATEAEERDMRLVSPCACKGTMQYVHETCLLRWVDELESKSSESSRSPLICPQCGKRYAIETPRPGLFLSMGKLCGRFCSEATPVMAMFGFCMCLWSGLALYGGLVYSTTCQVPLRAMMTYNSPKRLFGLLPFIPLTLIGAHTIAQVRLHITISTHGVWNIHVMSAAAAAANAHHHTRRQQQEQLQEQEQQQQREEEHDDERDGQQRGRHNRRLLHAASRSRSSSRDHPHLHQTQRRPSYSRDGGGQRYRHHFGQRHRSEHRSGSTRDPRDDERVQQRLQQLRQLEQQGLLQPQQHHHHGGSGGAPTYFEEHDYGGHSHATEENSVGPRLVNGHSEWAGGDAFSPRRQSSGAHSAAGHGGANGPDTGVHPGAAGGARAGFDAHRGHSDTGEEGGAVYAYSSDDDGEFVERYMRGEGRRGYSGEDEADSENRDMALAYEMLNEWVEEEEEEDDDDDDGTDLQSDGDLLMEMEDEMYPNQQLRPFDFLQIVIGSLTLPFISTFFGRLLFSKPSRHPLESVFLGGFVYEVAKAVLVSEYSRQKRNAQSGRIVRNVAQ